ncbi:MAG: undecaprenyldiphospho-muramoylpentapeptide beta-N-acetylglucosaminyltransferase, partial [Chloroflexota bacterium]|nr:undecaprenyldiphospho-muramoylpentapeptide beta-N-acetylglucosaminyltransferase [Chloroflexota bacterium]
PGTGGDEQTRNARLLEAAGGAVVLPQSGATSERLREILLRLVGDDQERARMAAASARVGRPDAASRLADALLALGDRSHNQER